MNRKQRQQNAQNYRRLMSTLPSGRTCRNCEKPLMNGEGHYAPPSLGSEGFFTCAAAGQ